MRRAPSLVVERERLARGARWVIGCDEVGRGALSGPVTVGVVAVDAAVGRMPRGLRDSKALAPGDRERLVPVIESWAAGVGIGHASSKEIDEVGIIAALGRAGRRAISALESSGDGAVRAADGVVLLDGDHDWLSPVGPPDGRAPVELRVRADVDCAVVAAASVVAKVARDRHMVELARTYPAYGWEQNKGYGVARHKTALAEHGPCAEHRLSWHLGIGPPGSVGAAPHLVG